MSLSWENNALLCCDNKKNILLNHEKMGQKKVGLLYNGTATFV